jgi:hypothetical protein
MMKKSIGKRTGSAISFLPDIDLDWDSAIVEELSFKAGNIEMLISIPKGDSKASIVKLRFEAICKADEVCYQFWQIVSKAFPKDGFHPKAKFSWLKSKPIKSGHYTWEVELALAPTRKPYIFRCKRIVALSKQGKPLTCGTTDARKKWRKQDYTEFLKLIGDLIVTARYDALLGQLSSKLRQKTTMVSLKKQCESSKLASGIPVITEKQAPSPKVQIALHWHDRSGTTIPDQPANLDPDTLRAFATVAIEPWFLMELIVVSDHDTLKVGKYSFHQEW